METISGNEPDSKPTKLLVLFVHGLGGSGQSTWGTFLKLIETDEKLRDLIDCKFFEYPTSFFRWPWSKKALRIQDLAHAIRFEINSRYRGYPNVLIVCHSLGCIVARKYLVEELKAKTPLRVKGALLFAAPNNGADLARWGNLVSWKHWQLRQLRTDSDFLEDIASDWAKLNCEQMLTVLEAVGGQDKVVARRPINDDIQLLAEKNHSDIVRPASVNDGPFVLFNNLANDVTAALSAVGAGPSVQPTIAKPTASSILFDIYDPSFESYCVNRREDRAVVGSLAIQNLWIFGESGVGKTVSLMRALSPSRRYRLISLGHFAGEPVHALYCALYEGLLSSSDQRKPIETYDWPRVIETICLQIDQIDREIKAILVEELPLATQKDFVEFFTRFCQLLKLYANLYPTREIKFAFSSVRNPRAGFKGGTRIAEMLKVLEFKRWRQTDVQKMVGLLDELLSTNLTDDNMERIVAAANGSPRFVKVFFRNFANFNKSGPSSRIPFEEALQNTQLEMVT